MDPEKDIICPKCNSKKIKYCEENYCVECVSCGMIFGNL